MTSIQHDDGDRSARARPGLARVASLLGQLFRSDVAVVAGGQLLQQALTLVTGVAIGRFLGASAYGVVNIARNIYAPLLILAPLGLDLALLKHVGRSDDAGAATMDRVTSRLRLVVLLVNLPIVIAGGLAGGAWLMRHVYRYPHFEIILLITLLALPIAADLQVLSAYYRARGRPGFFALMTLYVQPVVRVVLVGLAFFFAPNAVAVVAITTAQIAISAVLVWAHLSRWRGSTAKGAVAPLSRAERRAEWGEVGRILKESGWMGVTLFVYGMMRFADILILGAYVPAKVVGAYTALSTVSQLVQVWPLAASQTLGPTISKRYHAGDVDGVRKALGDYLSRASIMSGFLFAGIAAFGDRLDLVFGKSFTFHSAIAFLMPLGYLVSATLAPMGYALSMTGRHRAELGILSAGAVVLLAMCYVFVPRFGDVGAAAAVSLTFGVINVARFAYVSRTLGFIPGRLADFAPPAVALVCAFSAKLTCEALFTQSFPEVFAACVLYALAYGAATWMFLLGPEQRARALARCAGIRTAAE